MKHRVASLLAAVALAGCGGGVYIGFDGGSYDNPPTVGLTAAVTHAAPGQTVRLAAAASDDDYVVEVVFYRVESDGSLTFIGSDGGAPYGIDAVMPNVAAGSTVRFAARATDSAGQRSDTVTVAVLAD